jgi:ATP-dependent helicase/nuclease subunit A
MNLIDTAAREAALDIQRSVIVSAGAGSGKTRALAKRVVKLLGVVQKPEEILAITFTRDAAREMRHRIIGFLEAAARGEGDADDLSALKRNQELGWGLLENVHRLRIMTFDAFCAWLAAQCPGKSRSGVTQVAQDAYFDYMAAAKRLFTHGDEAPWAAAFHTVLAANRMDVDRVIEMIAQLLMVRSQWLPLIVTQRRLGFGYTPESLLRVLADEIDSVRALMPAGLEEEFEAIADYVLGNIRNVEDHALADLAHFNPGMDVSEDAMRGWVAMSNLLLTKQGTVRKSVTVREGFPAGGGLAKERKQQFLEILAAVSQESGLVSGLIKLQDLPVGGFRESDQELGEALETCLIYGVALLRERFAEVGHVDFAEVTAMALDALEDGDQITDLALRLDAQINHILVDEFQDTDAMQIAIIDLLTREWMPHEGRTLFVVGDPKQAIYRFRQADVRYFLLTEQNGVNQIALENVRLECNFRSQGNVVGLNNTVFSAVFPVRNDVNLSAIAYQSSVSVKEPSQPGIKAHALPVTASDRDEALTIVNDVGSLLDEATDTTIAILGRSRPHLKSVLWALKERGIQYSAIDMLSMSEIPCVQDLVALIKGMHDITDRLSWAALLRSPLIGLGMEDLERVCTHADVCILDVLEAYSEQDAGLDDMASVKRVVPLFKSVLARWDSMDTVGALKGLWHALGGLAFYNAVDMGYADQAWQMLVKCVSQNQIDLKLFERMIEAAYVSEEYANARVKVMTIHKSKGLEFDYVLIPGLDKAPRSAESKLLEWDKYHHQNGDISILMAPLVNKRETSSPVYQWLKSRNKEQEVQEQKRLLYVAFTRAMRQIYTYFRVDSNTDGFVRPGNASFLAMAFDELLPYFETVDVQENESNGSLQLKRYVTRSHQALQNEGYAQPLSEFRNFTAERNEVLLTGEEEWLRGMGTVGHLLLQKAFSRDIWVQDRTVVKRLVIHEGVAPAAMDTCVDLIIKGVTAMSESGVVDALRQAGSVECEQGLLFEGEKVIPDVTVRTADKVIVMDHKFAQVSSRETLAAFAERLGRDYFKQMDCYRRALRLKGGTNAVETWLNAPLAKALIKVHEAGWFEVFEYEQCPWALSSC